MRAYGRRSGDERGAAAVEFALVVPILILVIVGIVNFGFLFAQQISLNNGARQAARYAAVPGNSCAEIETEGRASAGTIGMPPSSVPTPVITNCPAGSTTVEPCAGSTAGDDVTITMTRSGAWVVTFPPFNVLPVPTLVGTGVMRCEFS